MPTSKRPLEVTTEVFLKRVLSDRFVLSDLGVTEVTEVEELSSVWVTCVFSLQVRVIVTFDPDFKSDGTSIVVGVVIWVVFEELVYCVVEGV